MLAALDHNSHKKELLRGSVEFSKASGDWVYKRKYTKKSSEWRQKLVIAITNDVSLNKAGTYNISGVTDKSDRPKNMGSLSKTKPTRSEAEQHYFSRYGVSLV